MVKRIQRNQQPANSSNSRTPTFVLLMLLGLNASFLYYNLSLKCITIGSNQGQVSNPKQDTEVAPQPSPAPEPLKPPPTPPPPPPRDTNANANENANENTNNNNQNQNQNSKSDDFLISLPGEKAPHATFFATVESNPTHLNIEQDFEITGYEDIQFQFPKACDSIKKWVTQVSASEVANSKLFRDTFQAAIAKVAQQASTSSGQIPQRPLFLDIGSNCGFFTQLAAKMGMAVHAYDLQPACVQHVAESNAANGFPSHQVQVYLAGVSDGVEKFFDHSSFATGCFGAFPARSSGVNLNDPNVIKRKTPLTSIDERYPPRQSMDQPPQIAMLKADTEGNEIKVMQGAMNNFRTKNIQRAIMEFTPMFWETRGYKKEDAIQALCQIQGFGYNISWHYKGVQLPDCSAIRSFIDGGWSGELSKDILMDLI